MTESSTPQTVLTDVLAKLGEPLPESAIQRTKANETRKGYDTDGYGYQAVVDRFNEVLGASWGFSWSILKETAGHYKSGNPYYDITVEVKIWVEPENIRSCVGGHIATLYADALKGAITNAFKKTAAFWGVGRQAYLGMLDDDNKPLPEEEGKGMRGSQGIPQDRPQGKPQSKPQSNKKPVELADPVLLKKIGALCMFMADGDKNKAEEYYHTFADFSGKDGKKVKAPALDKLSAGWSKSTYGKLIKQFEELNLDPANAYYEYGDGPKPEAPDGEECPF